jgi:hypothetical protein
MEPRKVTGGSDEKDCLAFGLMTTDEILQRQIIVTCTKYYLQATVTNVVTKRIFGVMSGTL